MAAGRIKGITIEIGGDTTKLVSALSKVDNALSKTQTNLRDINKALKLDPTNTALLKDKQQELAHAIDETKQRLQTEKQAYEELSHADKTPENVEKMRQLKVQIDLDTAALKELKSEARDAGSVLGSQMQVAGQAMTEFGDKVKAVGEKLTNLGQTLTTKVTVPIAAAFGGSVKSAIDWESAFTGVMKTVDETANTTYDDLKKSINEIAETTASSQNEIAAVMEIGGQLGVTADDLTDFTKIMVELGDTTNMQSEEAAASIAKFVNITNMSMQDADRLGAVIVDLGNNYATTEQDIMNMSMRLAGAGAQIGLSEGEILGLATALSSAGIEAEMGGSAFSKAMIKMQVAVETGFTQVNDLTEKAGMSLRDLELMSTNDTKSFKELAQSLGMTTTEIKEVITNGNNLNNFAEVAGVTTEEFVKLYQDDAPAALQAFISGLGDTESKGESTIAMLQDMGFTEVRLRDTLTRLANAEGMVTEAMAQGNEAWSENSALSEEAEKRYATMESQLAQTKARFTEIAVEIGEMLMPYVQQLMDKIEQLMEKWNGLDESQKETILKVAAIVAVVGPLLVVIGSVVSAIGTIISVIGTVMSVIGALLPILMGPIGIIALIVAAIVALGVIIYKNWDDIKAWAQGVWDAIKDMAAKVVAKILELKEAFVAKWNEIKTNVVNAVTAIKTGVVNTFNNIKSSIANTIGNIKSTIVNGFQNAVDYIRNLPSQARQWGADIINGIVSGIRDKISAVKDAISGVADTIKSYIHFSEPDVGPLSDFNTYMPDMIKGLVSGIENGIPQIQNAMTDMTSAMVPNIANNPNGGTTNNANVNITVYGAEGQNVNELADIIQQRINGSVYSKGAVFA